MPRRERHPTATYGASFGNHLLKTAGLCQATFSVSLHKELDLSERMRYGIDTTENNARGAVPNAGTAERASAQPFHLIRIIPA